MQNAVAAEQQEVFAKEREVESVEKRIRDEQDSHEVR